MENMCYVSGMAKTLFEKVWDTHLVDIYAAPGAPKREENKNLIYIPATLFHVGLSSASATHRFEIVPRYFYADGTEEEIFLDPLEYASLVITFEKQTP